MAMMPARVKYRKHQKGKGDFKGNASRGNYVAYGEYGIQVLQGGRIIAAGDVARVLDDETVVREYLGQVYDA